MPTLRRGTKPIITATWGLCAHVQEQLRQADPSARLKITDTGGGVRCQVKRFRPASRTSSYVAFVWEKTSYAACAPLSVAVVSTTEEHLAQALVTALERAGYKAVMGCINGRIETLPDRIWVEP